MSAADGEGRLDCSAESDRVEVGEFGDQDQVDEIFGPAAGPGIFEGFVIAALSEELQATHG